MQSVSVRALGDDWEGGSVVCSSMPIGMSATSRNRGERAKPAPPFMCDRDYRRSTALTDRHIPRTKRPSRARRSAPLATSISMTRRHVSRSQPHSRPASSAVSARPGISRYSPIIRCSMSASSSCGDLDGAIVAVKDRGVSAWFTVAGRTRCRIAPPTGVPRHTPDTFAHSIRFHSLDRLVRPSDLWCRKCRRRSAAQPDAAVALRPCPRNRRTTASSDARGGIGHHGAPSSDLRKRSTVPLLRAVRWCLTPF